MKNLFPIVLISLILISCLSNPKQKPETLKYHLVSRQVNSDISKMAYRIMLDVDSLPTDEKMRNTATSIWKNGNQKWKEFSVSMYLSDMNTESTEYVVGNFNKDGLSSFFKYEGALLGTKWEVKKIETPIELKRNQEPIETMKEFQSEKLKEYTIAVSTTGLGERKIKITINTNFPDGTNLNINIGREYNVKGETETYAGNLLDKDFSVVNGKYDTIIIINDTEWYNEHQRLARALPNDIHPVTKISDKITIDVLYTAAATQPENVIKILGTRGEFVTGEGSEHFGTGTAGRLTLLRVTKNFNFPREGNFKKQSEYGSYQSLKKDVTYSISKETPLMPEFEPADPIAAMSNIKYLNAGSRIKILAIKSNNNFPWYEVMVMNKIGESIGKGWINSTALIGQEILVIK